MRDEFEGEGSFRERFKSFIVWLFALEITEAERFSIANDPLNVFAEDYSTTRPQKRAAILALLFHLLLALISLPWLTDAVLDPPEVLMLQNLALPAKLAGGSPPEPAAPEPKPEPVAPKPEAPVVPIPDPTPADPEPIRKEITLETPTVMDEVAADLNIGDIEAPDSGSGRGESGTGSGPSRGAGPGAGDGSGQIYELGSGITNPVLIHRTTPSYTDEAIKAKVQGVVLLSAVIGKDGSVSQLRVLRGLGYGLEEKAIQEIATNWKFLPGRRGDQAVAVRATIEVTFNLR